jgi:hypothetical protein
MKSDGTGQGGLATAADVNAIVTRLIEVCVTSSLAA